MAGTGRKLFYKIGEVCKICGIQPHVLRYWETEFTALSPTKNRAGQRIYREKDVRLVQTIKHLLYEEGYTISGANKKILEDGNDLPLFEKAAQPNQRRLLADIRTELKAILDLLDDS